MTSYIHRIGLASATVAAMLTVGGFFFADGYLGAQHASPAPVVTALAAPSPVPSAPPTPQVVYVRPAPSPKVIHVTRTAQPAPRRVIHVTVPTVQAESGDGGDSGGGD